jgi:hypothetical protein
LRETLGLELNASKTLITHARTRAARFLGYQITVQHSSTRLTKGRRTVNGKVALQVPKDAITATCGPYRHQGKPWHRPPLLNLDDRRWCELCDHGATVTVHHVAKLAQLGKAGPGQPAWAALMARKRRKTLIVCRPCHDYIHASPVANAAQSLESPVH